MRVRNCLTQNMKKRLISVVVLILYGTICAESYGTNSGHNSQHYHHHNHGDTNNRHQGGSGEGGGSSSPTGGFSSKVEAILQWKQMEIEGLMEVPGRGRNEIYQFLIFSFFVSSSFFCFFLFNRL